MGKYDMKIAKIALKDCVSPDYNPRRISDLEFKQLKESIRRYGYNDPIIINQRNNHIVAGNQRYKALMELNRENHGKYTNITVNLVDLNPLDEKAFNIAHNQIGGDFDDEMLELILDELKDEDYDLFSIGFSDELPDEDLDEFLEDDDEILLKDPSELGDVEYVLTVKCASKGQSDFLFKELRDKGYSVKATQY